MPPNSAGCQEGHVKDWGKGATKSKWRALRRMVQPGNQVQTPGKKPLCPGSLSKWPQDLTTRGHRRCRHPVKPQPRPELSCLPESPTTGRISRLGRGQLGKRGTSSHQHLQYPTVLELAFYLPLGQLSSFSVDFVQVLLLLLFSLPLCQSPSIYILKIYLRS